MQNLEEDEYWMQRALDLAELGSNTTLPNPMVGCVIVIDGELIAEGWHMKFGEAHAEVNALNKIKHLSPTTLKKATVYVTLEPCSHFGKTPPCADLLIFRGVGRVVTSMEDPNPKVSGRGHKRLKDAGITVKCGVLEKKAMFLNRKFIAIQSFTKPRPYIVLKWAQSQDGFIDTEIDAESGRGGYAITGKEVKDEVHKLRAENNGILIGNRTAIVDNPSLTVREIGGVNPTRIIIDPELRVDIETLKMKDKDGVTLILCSEKAITEYDYDQVKILPWLDLEMEVWLCKLKEEEGINSLLVEGGATTHSKFINLGLYDEIIVFSSQFKLYRGLPAPKFPEVNSGKVEISQVGIDVRKHYFRIC
ncbi:MAG: riboflavin biosynthesis protein RibD [Bacteroidetes bacterium]|nr:MAG: riboflavin biosynthesis protein RibD [Bacteroidota bacterium]